ncbi:flagellar hook assembly protein FlgD [Brevundimonas lenta]|uniref:Basal-body rod modification protein FlgD n=1 Tax=Brevundimonas lenta TaxID=424796 RepID=A0A7W6JEN9_9CAUL|nr:flagellar hook capping FlgD N-terminal domain-containing protein [Brevundimonas lenta]MBB4083666.1 flagellar basal-body rod modification protein FlgD [Brevundimonas lenta]
MVDAVSTNQAANRINAGGTMMASNFETFLALLTAQLKNQDPLSPVDSNQFTAQLTQMAGVEQQLLTNDLLTSLLAAQQTGGLGEASTYIGKEATAAWSAVKFEDGKATWSYELAEDAKEAKLQVVDSSGKVVWTGNAPDLKNGIHDFSWDGKTTGGGQVPEGGVYTLKIVAKDAAAETVESQVLVRGVVTGVEMYDGQPYLTIKNSILPLSSVISLNQPKPDSDNDDAPVTPAAAA